MATRENPEQIVRFSIDSARLPPNFRVVDTTGAGDCFVGSFASALSCGLSTAHALDRALTFAAHSVTRRGTQPSYLTAEEADHVYQEHTHWFE